MKKRIPSFLAGMLTMALIGSLAVPVLASAGMTINVDPINIQVNGAIFAPKDINGKDVPVFAYNGSAYAPLRALAEAYGLEVGYDSTANMATVNEPGTTPTTPATPATPSTDYSKWSAEEEAAYQEFKGMWDASLGSTPVGPAVNLYCRNTEDAVDSFLTSHTVGFVEKCCYRLDSELYKQYKAPEIMYHFSLRGPWGWENTFFSNEWECGYKRFLEH